MEGVINPAAKEGGRERERETRAKGNPLLFLSVAWLLSTWGRRGGGDTRHPPPPWGAREYKGPPSTMGGGEGEDATRIAKLDLEVGR